MNKKILKTMIVLGMLLPTIKPQAFVLDKLTCTETNTHKEWRELPKDIKKKIFEPIKCQETIDSTKKKKSHISVAIPTSYSSKNVNGNGKSYVTSVKNQVYEDGEDSNLCWAFSTVSAVETAYSKENDLDNSQRDQIDLSEEQLGQVVTYRYANGEINPDGYYEHEKDDGGNFFIHSAPTVAARKTFVTETTVRFGATLERAHANIKSQYIAKDSITGIFGETGKCTPSELTELKEAIYKYGSVTAAVAVLDQSIFGIDTENVFNSKNNVDAVINYLKTKGDISSEEEKMLNYLKQGVGHAITLVGYDDDYDKQNFSLSARKIEANIPGFSTPQNNGAFIVKDSYYNSGNNGYYYLSYEDDLMCSMGYAAYENIEEVNSTNINSYNETSTGFTLGELSLDKKTRVFFKKNIELKSTEIIKELSVYAAKAGDEIEVAYSPEENATLESKMVNLGAITATHAGWTTIEVDEEASNELGTVNGTGTLFLEYFSDLVPIGEEIPGKYVIQKEGDIGYISVDGVSWESSGQLHGETLRVYPLVNVFTETVNGGKSFEVKRKFESANLSVEKGGTITIELDTENMNASDIDVSIVNSANQNITDKFDIVKGTNKIDIKLTSESPAGNIVIKLSYNGRERFEKASIPAAANVKVTKITLTGTEEMALGGELHLTAKIEPENATNQTLSWKSSDETVATVENGVVKGLKEGKVVITATAQDGSNVSASHALKVVKIVSNNENTPKPNTPNKGNDNNENPNTGVKDTILPLSIVGLCGVAFYLHTNNNNMFKRSL